MCHDLEEQTAAGTEEAVWGGWLAEVAHARIPNGPTRSWVGAERARRFIRRNRDRVTVTHSPGLVTVEFATNGGSL
jgi:hypothetical protein